MEFEIFQVCHDLLEILNIKNWTVLDDKCDYNFININ